MQKNFDSPTREAAIYRTWEQKGLFTPHASQGRTPRDDATAEAASTDSGKGFTVVIPPPNVTGRLHIGHALNNTLQDILVRWHRANGDRTLWQPGTDHAGIATQMVVERKLNAEGISRESIGRAAFLDHVWKWKAESGGAIANQLRTLGASADWSRERFTMDEGLSEAVIKSFVALYRDGYIYRANRLVNWDPKLETAISDLEIVWRDVESHYWHITYALCDQEGNDLPAPSGVTPAMARITDDAHAKGTDDASANGTGDASAKSTDDAKEDLPANCIVIATRRPETMFADVAVAVHPDDPRYQHLIGQYCRTPITGRIIPIIADSFVAPEEGSGAVKITPAHDFGDQEVSQRHGLPSFSIFDEKARLIAPAPADYVGMDREPARAKVVEALEAAGQIIRVDHDIAKVPYGDRGGVPIEPRLTLQWFVKTEDLAAKAQEAVHGGHINFHPAGWIRTWDTWLNNIQPWCISRQLWWGHRIPAWYSAQGEVFVAPDAEQAAALAQAEERKTGKTIGALTQDPDVLDTWFSSALWPFSTLGWPDTNDPVYQQHFPTDVLVTGFDILFFWVARMVMFSLYFHQDKPIEQAIPFKDVYVHALVRDKNGQKMSKSKGNVVDPLDLVAEYGCDATRFALASLAAPGRDVRLLPGQFEWSKHVMTKTWNAVRFLTSNGVQVTPSAGDARGGAAPAAPAAIEHPFNLWIVHQYENARRTVDQQLTDFRFDLASHTIYNFV